VTVAPGETAAQIVRIITLNGMSLSEQHPILRDHTRHPARRTEHYTARFDRTTLFYDLVRHDETGRLLITAPPFANLWPLLRDGVQANGRPVRLRRRRFLKYDQVTLKDAPALTLSLTGQRHVLRPRADIGALFAGLNCVVTMNCNNPLDWIQIWADHHCRMHDLQAVLIYDNGSTDYTLNDLADALKQISGLRRIVIAAAPFPYGTTDPVQRGERRENYLQPALLNLARTDILRKARAVLNVDIDEIVLARGNRGVFEHAARSTFGVVRLPVYWAHPPTGTPGPAPQTAHTHRDQPKQRTPRKWCAYPRRGFGRLPWSVHHIGGEIYKLMPQNHDFEVVHCRATSIGWHTFKNRHADSGATLFVDPELRALWGSEQASQA